MIRILYDELGDWHSDIFLKVDALPNFVQVADTYFLGDFLGYQDTDDQKDHRKIIVIQYLHFLKDAISGLSKEETFIPFDLSDQYVGGFIMSKTSKGHIKARYSYTDKIQGPLVGRNDISQLLKERQPDFHSDREWLLSAASVQNGLDWSIQRINKTSSG